MLLGAPVSYKDYNHLISGTKFFLWVGLGYAFLVYTAIFNLQRTEKNDKADWIDSTCFLLPTMTMVLLLLYMHSDGPSWSNLYAFSVSFLGMFLLWALTRAPKPLKKVEEKPGAVE